MEERPESVSILLVDDDAVVRSAAASVLERQGYSVIVASSGEEAIRLFERHAQAIALLLTDLMMPGMSGTQLAAELWKRKPELHVILTSGWSEGSSRFAGHLTFIPKPFSADELLRHVERTLGTSPPEGTGKT